ncbi:SAP domain-containing protein [Colletotrichum orchidophilum]|uniref:SAP domain-containing protein n=1 Tax=Colletotrichum orchidophilum TaxID=1209926 RepID=A0A1G4AYZ6_9PEZI|nr:SAP domain-containing protein [Colletotrichum orchidophilum]OHE94303.1 SAP domain-containing protein [Colletotrichum orchidophilum]
MNWSKQTVVQLKAELKRRGLATAGLKQELVDRLTSNDEAAEEEVQEEEASPEPEPQPAESLEALADPAPIDTTTEDVAVADSEITSAEAVVTSTRPIPEQSVVEPGNEDTKTKVPESIAAANPTPPGPAEIAQDAQKRKRRSQSPAESSESISRKRIKADQDRIEAGNTDNAPSPEPAGFAGIINQAKEVVKDTLKESLEGGSSLLEDVAEDAKNTLKNIEELNEGHSIEQDQPTTTKAIAEEDTEMVTPRDELNGKVDAGSAADHGHRQASVHDEEHPEDGPVTKQGRHDIAPTDDNGAMEYERTVQPAIHPATRALYIKNLMRPLKESMVHDRLVELATPSGAEPNSDDIEDVYLDSIKSHAFAVFRTTTLASRVRNALHDVTWPDESNRKPLSVDFVPPERVRDWIQEEEAAGKSNRSARWAVRYDTEDDGYVTARLVAGNGPAPALSAPEPVRNTPPGPAVKDVNAIPLGPRGGRGFEGAPLGPRGDSQRGPGPRPPRLIENFPGGPVQTTRAHPSVSYQAVSDDLVSRRLRNMRSYYTKDIDRDMGPETEINRYIFEEGDKFVDRGHENFVGIRPPHREAERRRQMAGGGPPPRGPPPSARGGRRSGNGRRGPRMVSDRYLPGINESGPYRQGDRGNFGPRPDSGRRFRSDDRGSWH